MNRVIENIMLAILFVVSVVFVFVGQKYIGYPGLFAELIGLAGIIGVVYMYNKRFK